MNSKKSLITVAIVIVVLVAGWYLWRGGFSWWGVGTTPVSPSPTEGITPATQPGVEGQTGGQGGGQTGGQTTGTNIGKMTDDIYVEIAAQTAYYSAKDPAGLAARAKDLLAKYGVNEENMTAYADKK